MSIRAIVLILAALVLASGPGSSTGLAADIKPSISEAVAPLEVITIKDPTGHELPAVVRRPPGGAGLRPAFVFLHGGLLQMSVDSLKTAIAGPLETLFLAEGYVVVQGTYRSRSDDPQRPETVASAVALLDAVKKLPGVDPKSVVVSGGSGGGSLALEVAAETDLAAIGPWEPATILFMGMMTKTNRVAVGDDPQRHWTPEVQQKTRERLSRLRCPVFMGHGDVNGIKKANWEVFVPELLKAGKPVQIHMYPGMPHSVFGFYFPNRMEYIKSFFADCNAMFKRYLPTQPVAMDRSLLEWVPDTPPKTDTGARTFVDLRQQSTIGLEDAPVAGERPVGSLRTRVLRLTVFLPAGSTEGEYEVVLLRNAAPILTMGGTTTYDEERNLVLQFQPNLTGYEIGRHVLGVRSVKGKWMYYPVMLRVQP